MTVASFVATQRTVHDVPHAMSCRALEISQSWFYKWRNRPPTARDNRRVELDMAVKASFDDSGGTPGTYGSPRVFADLIEAGWKVSVNTVAASMARQGLQGRTPKRKRRSLTRPDKAAAPIPDLVRRDFNAEEINHKWCGDLTEIPTDEGKLYLATVEDLASRRLPGFAIGEHHDAALARAALCMAAAVRGGQIAGVIFHSDKGGEYTGDVFANACASLGTIQSMGRVGSALDNAVAESFNSTLEWELLSRRHFATKAQARSEIATFIDNYNHRRRHSSCEMIPPRGLRTGSHRTSRPTGPKGAGRMKPLSRIVSETLDPSRSEPMGDTISYKQPSTVSGEAQSSVTGYPVLLHYPRSCVSPVLIRRARTCVPHPRVLLGLAVPNESTGARLQAPISSAAGSNRGALGNTQYADGVSIGGDECWRDGCE